MTLVPFSTLVPKAAVSAVGCPDAVIEGHLRDAAIRTCERTHYHRTMLSMTLKPNRWIYEFDNVPIGSEVFTLLSASINDRNVPVMAPDILICRFPQWGDAEPLAALGDSIYNNPFYDETMYNEVMGMVTGTVQQGSNPQAISRISPCNFVVLPKPGDEVPYKLRMYVSLRPTTTASGLDDCVFRDLGDAIVHGALQELLMLPQAHWTNPDLATYHARQYLFKLTERRARANLGYSRGALVAHVQPFGV